MPGRGFLASIKKDHRAGSCAAASFFLSSSKKHLLLSDAASCVRQQRSSQFSGIRHFTRVPATIDRIRLAFNGNILLLINRLLLILRDLQRQNTILVFRVNVLFSHTLTYIVAAAHAAGITFSVQVLAVLCFFVLIQALLGADDQVTILQVSGYFVSTSGNEKFIKSSKKLFLKILGVYICQTSYLIGTPCRLLFYFSEPGKKISTGSLHRSPISFSLFLRSGYGIALFISTVKR